MLNLLIFKMIYLYISCYLLADMEEQKPYDFEGVNLEQNSNTNQKGPGDEKMQSAYKFANVLIRDRLRKESEDYIKILEGIEESDVISVDGTYDHIHLVLELSNIPFKRISPADLNTIKLRPDQTIFVNCASNFDNQAARVLSSFVANGGLLITTDWALSNVLEVAFPGYVRYNKKPTRDEVVRIEVLDREDPVLTGFFDEEKDTTPMWWLEGSSYPIEIIDKDKVKKLIISKELG
jgi:hypothetical protein